MKLFSWQAFTYIIDRGGIRLFIQVMAMAVAVCAFFLAMIIGTAFAILDQGIRNSLQFLDAPLMGTDLSLVNLASLVVYQGNSSAFAEPTPLARQEIPGPTLDLLINESAKSPCGLGWPVLAAIAWTEDRSFGAVKATGPPVVFKIPNSPDRVVHAYGPAQFLLGPGSWPAYGDHVDPPAQFSFDPSTGRDIELSPAPDAHIWQPKHAYEAMDKYLCASKGAGLDLRSAIFAYNHSQSYVDGVLAKAALYGSLPDSTIVIGPGLEAVRVAKLFLDAHTPYVWGGESLAGADCSGLTKVVAQQVYHINLPHNAQMQWDDPRIQHIPRDQPLQPGDFAFFWGTDNTMPPNVSHVGVVSRSGIMINEPDFGMVASEASYTQGFWGAHFIGGGRIKQSG